MIWGALQAGLTGDNIGVTQVPDDPLAPSQHYFYGSDGISYQLGALLENMDNPALKDSDHTDGFIDCTPVTMYCVSE